MNEYLLLILAIIIHEFFHYITFRYYGFKPKVSIKYWGSICIGDNCHLDMKVKNYIVVLLAGVISGYLFLRIFTPGINTYLIYIVLSSVDLVQVFGLIFEKNKNLTGLESLKKLIKEYEESKLK